MLKREQEERERDGKKEKTERERERERLEVGKDIMEREILLFYHSLDCGAERRTFWLPPPCDY